MTNLAHKTASSPARARKRYSPRQRQKMIRAVQYAFLLLILVLVLWLANWRQIGASFFDPKMIGYTLTHGFISALWHTAAYTAGGFVLGLIAGTVLALMRLSQVAPYRWLATVYIEFFRGLPALVVFIAFSLLPLAFSGLVMPWEPFGSAWAALGMVGAAYMAETIRAGINAVPPGQIEAARSLGMTAGETLRKVTLPQAFRIMVPPLTNELIMLIKDSSLVFVVGLSASSFELTMFGRSTANANINITPLVVAGLGYLAITLPLSLLARRIEAKHQ